MFSTINLNMKIFLKSVLPVHWLLCVWLAFIGRTSIKNPLRAFYESRWVNIRSPMDWRPLFASLRALSSFYMWCWVGLRPCTCLAGALSLSYTLSPVVSPFDQGQKRSLFCMLGYVWVCVHIHLVLYVRGVCACTYILFCMLGYVCVCACTYIYNSALNSWLWELVGLLFFWTFWV